MMVLNMLHPYNYQTGNYKALERILMSEIDYLVDELSSAPQIVRAK
jgi:hypothetical protein